jgi:hypothetical protein
VITAEYLDSVGFVVLQQYNSSDASIPPRHALPQFVHILTAICHTARPALPY